MYASKLQLKIHIQAVVYHRTCDETWTLRVSSVNWKHFYSGVSQPRRIVAVCLFCALEILLLTYLLTYGVFLNLFTYLLYVYERHSILQRTCKSASTSRAIILLSFVINIIPLWWFVLEIAWPPLLRPHRRDVRLEYWKVYVRLRQPGDEADYPPPC